jgi:hypothetical protein
VSLLLKAFPFSNNFSENRYPYRGAPNETNGYSALHTHSEGAIQPPFKITKSSGRIDYAKVTLVNLVEQEYKEVDFS